MASELNTDVLYYGDNLDILRKYIPDNSVDLIYLDPPFNSKKDYNILFKENGGLASEAQIHAFSDSWHWTQSAQDAYQEIAIKGPLKLGKLIDSLRDAIGSNDVMAYLVMMTVRLIELHRVLKPTGSLYLHCDPTASHYLKIVLDQIFGPANFRNEIVWRRTNAKGLAFTRFASNHDTILRYSKSEKAVWHPQYKEHDSSYLKTFYRYVEEGTGRRYRLDNLANPNKNRPNLTYEFLGVTRVWRWTKKRMQEAYEKGLVVQSSPGAVPSLKRYLDEQEGTSVDDIWDDILPVQAQAKERLGYETQKPLALLERIISASSDKGDVVLDPFCGCGTAVIAAQKLNRKWIGIDITHLAINLMRNRLKDSFPRIKFEVIGEPKDLSGASALANQDRYQFQWWALGLIGARPVGDKKKGADKGIDGIIPFIDNPESKVSRVVIQVKSGYVGVNAVRELQTVAAKEAIGVLITLESPTAPMISEAVSAGYYHSPLYGRDYHKIQILTIEELFQGKMVDMPSQTQTSIAFTKAPKIKKSDSSQSNMIYTRTPNKTPKVMESGAEQLPFYGT
ncbi:MAG: DNA methyltransferase [Dehalococcoidales bacterium]|nr:DNA methyltransferase [Dehalococcoidales bacterium]